MTDGWSDYRQTALRAGDPVPHFDVSTLDGTRVRYADLWQRRKLVLLVLPEVASAAARHLIEGLRAHAAEIDALQGALVMTMERVCGLSASALVVADQWGEIAHAETPANVSALSSPDEVVDWLRYVSSRCPECEGEYR